MSASPEWQFINMIQHEYMPPIFGHIAPLASETANILRRTVTAAIDVLDIGSVVRPCISQRQRQPLCCTLLHACLQRMVFRIAVIGPISYVRDIWIDREEGAARPLRSRP